MLLSNQIPDADNIRSAINAAFNDIFMPELASKVVFLASDGASVDGGVKSGVAVKFCEAGVPWLAFVWCLSHRLELVLDDHLEEVMERVKKCLTNLFYYGNSSKILRELRKSHSVLSELYQFEDGRVKPSKCSGTRWIVHRLRSMFDLVDKFGLYLHHFENIIVNDSKNIDKAILEEKHRQLTDSRVLLLLLLLPLFLTYFIQQKYLVLHHKRMILM